MNSSISTASLNDYAVLNEILHTTQQENARLREELEKYKPGLFMSINTDDKSITGKITHLGKVLAVTMPQIDVDYNDANNKALLFADEMCKILHQYIVDEIKPTLVKADANIEQLRKKGIW
jgi:hypothetical protein